MSPALVIHVSCSSREEAAKIARALVQRRLAACVHIAPHDSVYRWNDEVETAVEWSLAVHTVSACQEAAEALIRELHSYSLPAILATPAQADLRTAQWLREATGTERHSA